MPTKPPIHKPFGDKTRHQRYDETRGSAHSRGYDNVWKKFRAQFVAQNPLCQDCMEEGKVTATQEIHHILKVRTHPELRLVPYNCRALCVSHHSARTARGE